MKCTESWLREWVNPGMSQEALCHALTMAGLEVEAVTSVSEGDHVIDVSLTPNRGDCLSIRGLAREIAAITKTNTTPLIIEKINPSLDEVFPLNVDAKAACPRYAARMIRGVNAAASSPVWLSDRLNQGGIRSINVIVDVTNYVMLELGQPMHAFDLDTLDQSICVRLSKRGEQITLLDGSEKILDDQTLLIADAKKPLAIAGIMGGLESGVTLATKNIFLESAFFTPAVIARTRQCYQLNSDSAHRFERGVDPSIQIEAIERATKLILEIAGGEAGPVMMQASEAHLPKGAEILLSSALVSAVLGIAIPEKTIEAIFDSLHFVWQREGEGWRVSVPLYRFDLAIPEDLIEEIARLYGYDHIPTHVLKGDLEAGTSQSAQILPQLKNRMRDFGYHEIITYSFVDSALQQLLEPRIPPIALLNPITAEMAVMRTSLWPGLITTMRYNKSRQQQRIRLFEAGMCFAKHDQEIVEVPRLAGLITGFAYPEQWGVLARPSDFFDLKGDVESLLKSVAAPSRWAFKVGSHPALHPGRSADIYLDDERVGWMGDLHPSIKLALDVPDDVILFEIDQKIFHLKRETTVQEVSKFPEIRRDIALLVKQTIPSKDIQDTIKVIAGDWLKDIFIFDLYRGKGISPDVKSVALALVFQDRTRTLVDEEIAELMDRIMAGLMSQLGAELRS